MDSKMYQEYNCQLGELCGKKYKLREPVKALCCPEIFPIGTIIEVHKYTSKYRLLISVGNGYHKIKLSTLNMAGELI